MEIPALVHALMGTYDCSAVFIEDIQMQSNVQSFKKLAQLQGALIASFKQQELLFEIIPPTTWQNWCGARGRSTKEVKQKIMSLDGNGKKASKVFSLQYVNDNFGVHTDNDNLADSLCIGSYVVNNIKIV